MNSKILAFDTETSGIGEQFGLQQFAAITIINGETIETFNVTIQPFGKDKVSPQAIEVHKIQPSQGVHPYLGYTRINDFFHKYIDKYNKKDKFTPLAYNGRFDLDAMKTFFSKNGDKYFGSWQNWNLLDPYPVLRILKFMGIIDVANLKLGTISKYFNIELKAHDAISDIAATVKIYRIIEEQFKVLDFNQPRQNDATQTNLFT